MTAIPLARPATAPDPVEDCSAFYARYRLPLVSYVAVAFPDVDAEGVVQDTFCRVLAHWTEVSQMRKPWPWLAVTARNLARNSIRDNAAAATVALDECAGIQDDGPELDHQVHAYDQLRMLGRAMRSLTPLQRQLAHLVLEEGLNGADAARRLGLSPGAGRMHLCRMRTRLTERFLGLGGQLAVAPLAALGFVMRRLRAASSTARRSTTFAGPTVLASSLAVATTIGIVHIGLAPTHHPLQARHTVSISPANAHEAALVRHSASTSPPRQAVRSTPTEDTHVATISAPALPAAQRHVAVASDPTRSGQTVDASLTVDTPAGRLVVGFKGTQHSDLTSPLCSAASDNCR